MSLDQPALSVVIPTYNRRERLRICLEALERQTQDPRTFEVVVADDGHGMSGTTRRSGLQNLEARAFAHDGTLELESTPEGTRLRLRLPLPADRGGR